MPYLSTEHREFNQLNDPVDMKLCKIDLIRWGQVFGPAVTFSLCVSKGFNR